MKNELEFIEAINNLTKEVSKLNLKIQKIKQTVIMDELKQVDENDLKIAIMYILGSTKEQFLKTEDIVKKIFKTYPHYIEIESITAITKKAGNILYGFKEKGLVISRDSMNKRLSFWKIKTG